MKNTYASHYKLLNNVYKDIIPRDKKLIFTNKGHVALEQILKSANLQGKKIIIPAFTWPGFIRIFKKYNIEPIFIDIDPNTYHMNLFNPSEFNHSLFFAFSKSIISSTRSSVLLG